MALILVVDDSESLRMQLRADLEKSGHEVLEASDGLEALRVFKEAIGIRIILCDINMPNMDGLSFCAEAAKEEKFKSIFTFMLTTETSVELKAKGKEIGIRAWITKPYQVDKLLAAIEKVLRA
jgi:two-component system chemotaxis response regulator CheY